MRLSSRKNIAHMCQGARSWGGLMHRFCMMLSNESSQFGRVQGFFELGSPVWTAIDRGFTPGLHGRPSAIPAATFVYTKLQNKLFVLNIAPVFAYDKWSKATHGFRLPGVVTNFKNGLYTVRRDSFLVELIRWFPL